MWEVEYTDEFGVWWDTLAESAQDAVAKDVRLLMTLGPVLGRPRVDSIKGSRFSNMKELRTQHKGQPLRTFFAFDPRRCAILLIGGNKQGDDPFYETYIPIAGRLYAANLDEIRKQGLI